ncbi:ATP-binding protein [Streptomyces sp. NPDC050534]|uniref:ATP-binding protein n=1 Tax=Streptomyces sp. NPDC050534 TaxID=3365625 RepID=UPI0037A92E80
MVIPLRKQAVDEQGRDRCAAVRYTAVWAPGAVRPRDVRRDLRAVLIHAARHDRARLPASLMLDAELVVSELVTNAVRHAPGLGAMSLQVTLTHLAITMYDTSSALPRPQPPDRHRVGGHGLHLVHQISDKVVVTSGPAGKQITAYLPLLPEHPTHDANAPVLPLPPAGFPTRPAKTSGRTGLH